MIQAEEAGAGFEPANRALRAPARRPLGHPARRDATMLILERASTLARDRLYINICAG